MVYETGRLGVAAFAHVVFFNHWRKFQLIANIACELVPLNDHVPYLIANALDTKGLCGFQVVKYAGRDFNIVSVRQEQSI
jgi:hypothetical protein